MNFELYAEIIVEAIHNLLHPLRLSLTRNNQTLHKLLIEAVPVGADDALAHNKWREHRE
ncbi:MAG: hypothetical protein LHW64_09265 [Candidatus Cloacimonetes bacterium]|nr:hypothetical protein [Candidatus Cloacimonadota bacterium]MDY0230301.1 hypothetical protein [Candidatus Cloacimonadaceae bacterium]